MYIILLALPLVLKVILIYMKITWRYYYNLIFVDIIINSAIAPVYLAAIVVQSSFKQCRKIQVLYFFIAILVIIGCIIISYVDWGISTGYFFYPDSETLLICNLEMITASIVFLISAWVLKIKKKK